MMTFKSKAISMFVFYKLKFVQYYGFVMKADKKQIVCETGWNYKTLAPNHKEINFKQYLHPVRRTYKFILKLKKKVYMINLDNKAISNRDSFPLDSCSPNML